MIAPRLLRGLLARLIPPDLRSAFLDDLDEAFTNQVTHRGWAKASLWYVRECLAGLPSLFALRLRRARMRRKPEDPGMTAIDTLGRDVRYTLRQFVRSPGFTLAAVTTLALGIGANTAIFSLIKTVMLRPLPYNEPDRLVVVWRATHREENTHLSIQEVVNYREARSLAQLAGYTDTNANLTGGQEPERVRAGAATPNLFDTLGVPALLGRTLGPADSAPGAEPVVILGHSLWQRRFGGDLAIVGRGIQVNGRARQVIGIMPAGFRLPLDYRVDRPTELWLPLVIDPANLGAWGNRSYFGVGRLRADAQPSNATSEFKVISDRWIRAGFVADSGDGGLIRSAIPLQDLITGGTRDRLVILFGAVAVVLLIACANVINLLLAKADARRREVAVRTALGAVRGQLVRQMLTESVLLALLGGIFGLAIAAAGLQALITIRPASVPRVEEATLDGGVLLFTGALALMTGVLFGLAPALQLSRPDLTGVLKDGGRSGTPGRARLVVRRGLVIAQLAFSVVLVVGAGLLVRSLVELYRIDLGFSPRNVLTAQMQLPQTTYPESRDVVAFYRNLMERIGGLPGVTAAGAVRVLPLAREIGDWSITIDGRPYVREENPNGDFQVVTPGYFKAMGTTLVRGRLLTEADREDAPLTVVVNDTMAERYWPGEEAIGKRFHMGGGGTLPWLTIVGIIRTSRHNAVVEAPRAEMYLPYAQLPQANNGAVRGMAIVVKTAGDPSALAGPLREAVRAIDPSLPLADVRSMDDITSAALSGPRFAALLLGVFALLALTLAAIGVYATMSLLVTERSHEIGIRMALGAGRGEILGLILRQGLLLAGAGVTIGLAGALFLGRLLTTLVYGVETSDPVTFAVVPALLAVVALAACLHPARRAATVDPVVTLRES